MKRYKLLFITVLTLFSITNIQSQTDFRKGYYISLQNDTVKGLIDYRGDIRNSKYCVFKKDSISDPIKYKPGEIKSYRFIDSKFYISKTIKTKKEEKQIFVEYLVNGIADLFFYKDIERGHYLLENNNGRLLELKNEKETVYIEGKGQCIRETNEYIGLLKYSFMDCMEMQSEIDKAELNHKSLINLTKKYHDYVCDGEKCIIYEKKQTKVRLQVAPIIGINNSNLSFRKIDYFSSFDFQKSIYPSIGILLNTAMPGLNVKLSFQTEIMMTKNYFYGFKTSSVNNTTYYDIHIHTSSIQSSFGLKYTYPKGRIQPNLAFGVMFDNYIQYDTKLTEETDDNSVVYSYEYIGIATEKFRKGLFIQIGSNYHLNKKYILFTSLKYSYLSGVRTNLKSINLNFGVFF